MELHGDDYSKRLESFCHFTMVLISGINERETVSKALQRSLQSRATESVTTSDTATKIGRGFQKNMKKLSKIIEKFVEV